MGGISRRLKYLSLKILDRMAPPEEQEVNTLVYWRVRILLAILLSGLAFTALALIPAVVMVFTLGAWKLLAMDIAVYCFSLIMLFAPRPNYRARAGIVVGMCYIVGANIVLNMGPLSGGPVWIFCFGVLVGVMFGAAWAAAAVLLNGLSLAGVCLLAKIGYYPPHIPLFINDWAMITALLNFIITNAIASISVALLVKGIVSLAEKERALSESLRVERHELIEAKTSLEREIEERISAEDEALMLSERLQRAEKMEMLGQLAGGVAHDLNNVLSGLVSYPDLILYNLPADSAMRGPLKRIKASGENAAAIVQDLLALARRGVAAKEVVCVNEVIEEYLRGTQCAKLLRENPGCGIHTELAPDLFNVVGSANHISKTVMNLVTNAVESMPDGGVVSLVSRNVFLEGETLLYEHIPEGEYVLISVADTGKGIDAEDLGHIFEPFYTKKKMGRSGTGLGLSVVWNTVKDHDGFVNVLTGEEGGATFEVYLPLTRQSGAARAEAASLAAYQGEGRLIMVVDDNPMQVEIASQMLTSLGYEVVGAPGGREALELMGRRPPDLVLLDMIMPNGWDGLETYVRMIRLNPGQKAVIASGYSETGRLREALRLGASRYIAKPYSMEKLARAVWLTLRGLDDNA